MPWEEGITRYSVTDLVLHSAEDLTALAAALEDPSNEPQAGVMLTPSGLHCSRSRSDNRW